MGIKKLEYTEDLEYITKKRSEALEKYTQLIKEDAETERIDNAHETLNRLHNQVTLLEDAMLIYNIQKNVTPMELNDIKKCLYKQKPKAKFLAEVIDYYNYMAFIEFNNEKHWINFKVPVSDMGEKTFNKDDIDAQLLIRWIVK